MQKTNNRLSKYLDVIYAIKRIEDKYKEFCYRRLPDEEFIKKKSLKKDLVENQSWKTQKDTMINFNG